MSTYKHTPGPWYQDTGRNDPLSILTKERMLIAGVCYDPNRGIQPFANARLIASAPEMLDALQNAANVLAALATGQLDRVEKDSPALLSARAVIAKAKGETS